MLFSMVELLFFLITIICIDYTSAMEIFVYFIYIE